MRNRTLFIIVFMMIGVLAAQHILLSSIFADMRPITRRADFPIKSDEYNGTVMASWNVRLFPRFISKVSPEIQNSRIAQIGEYILGSGADLFVLQEVWDPKYAYMIRSWTKSLYPYSLKPKENPAFYKLGSGLMVLSKYPLTEIKLKKFGKNQQFSPDSFAEKGIYKFIVNFKNQSFVFG